MRQVDWLLRGDLALDFCFLPNLCEVDRVVSFKALVMLACLSHRCQVVNLRNSGLLHSLKMLLNLLARPSGRLFLLFLDLLILDVER